MAVSKQSIAEHLAAMERAMTADELEDAIQTAPPHPFEGRTWARISAVRIRKGIEICDAHPHGQFVPRLGPRRRLEVCGETFRVGRGQNGAGARYAWHDAGQWAMGILQREGFSVRAAHRIWGGWRDYPHRVLGTIGEALAGNISDPELGVLHPHNTTHGAPINYTVEENDADVHGRRATRTCQCGGTLFDWGAGWSEGFDFVNWHCNKCPEVFTEYMTSEQLYRLRNSRRAAEGGGDGS